jgi:hypothetical protein
VGKTDARGFYTEESRGELKMSKKTKKPATFNGICVNLIKVLIEAYGDNYTAMSRASGYTITKLIKAVTSYQGAANNVAARLSLASNQVAVNPTPAAIQLDTEQVENAFPHYATVTKIENVRLSPGWESYFTPIEAHRLVHLPQLLELHTMKRLTAFNRLLMLYCRAKKIPFLDIEVAPTDTPRGRVRHNPKTLLMFPLNVIKNMARHTVAMGRLRKGAIALPQLTCLVEEVLNNG